MNKQLKKITTSCLIAATLLASTGVFAMDSEEFNRRMDEGMKAYIQKDYATATNLFQRLYNEGSLDYEQEQRVLKFLDSSKSNQYGLPSKNQSNTQTTTQQTTNSNSLSTAEFDSGMAKGIWYFNKGMYYEAKDEFQWFCDYNWGRMNAGQQKYALDYLGSAKQKIQQWETSQKNNSYFPIPGTKLNFTLVNHSGNDISGIYISEITHDTWEENILNENLLSYDSSRISFTGTFDTSQFDLLFICVDGEEIVFKDIDLSVVNTATLTYNGYDGYNLNW